LSKLQQLDGELPRVWRTWRYLHSATSHFLTPEGMKVGTVLQTPIIATSPTPWSVMIGHETVPCHVLTGACPPGIEGVVVVVPQLILLDPRGAGIQHTVARIPRLAVPLPESAPVCLVAQSAAVLSRCIQKYICRNPE
jgi:hypothetical protein